MRRLLAAMLLVATFGFVGRGGLPCDAFAAQPRCYVGLFPGPTADTLQIVRITGGDVSASTGELLLTTVSVQAELSFADWVRGTVSPSIRTVDRELVFPDGTSTEEVRQQNAAMMDSSQLVATVAGLRAVGLEFDTDADGSQITDVTEWSGAARFLLPGDILVRGAGDAIRSNEDLARILLPLDVGDEVELEFLRDGERFVATVPMVADPQTGHPVIGITVRTYLELPVDVVIDAGVIGGPSAGTMFALAIVDLLTPQDLTAGRVIAGTGEIDENGRVYPIGGIQQKILGAMRRPDGAPPAEVFLAPAANFEEAVGTPVEAPILIVPIATLDDAVRALRALADGRTPVDAVTISP